MNYDFGAQVREITKRTRIKLENVVEKITLELARRVILATPVDTGALRGNWFSSYEAPNTSFNIDIQDPGGTNTITKVSASINGGQMMNKVWYLTNSLPYAYRIEYEGWSHTKAPAGMVRVSISGYQQALIEALK